MDDKSLGSIVGGGTVLLCQMMWILLTKLHSGCKSKSWHL